MSAQVGHPHEAMVQIHKALSHWLRVEILGYLTKHGSGSPSSIGRALDVNIPDVSAHCKLLVKYGAIELAEERETNRGTPEHIYRPITRAAVDDEDAEGMNPCDRERFVGQISRHIAKDIQDGFLERSFADRHDWVVSQHRLSLDAQGWEELRGRHAALYEAAYEIQARSDARRARSGEAALDVVSDQISFRVR